MLKFIYDFLPIIIFFGTYKLTDNDIYAATTAAIIATILHTAIQWFMHKKLENQHIINLVVILFFGGLTLLFQDDTFIKWKVTVINWIFALALLGSQFIGKKNIIQRQLDKAIQLPAPIWVRLNMMWVAFFLFCGLINLYVAFFYGLELSAEARQAIWVDFKMYGMLGLTFAFMISQIIYLQRHMLVEEKVEEEETT
ncbi:MAG: septation protein A [gamma proteobacterium symbiont of Bathyaustriella thionipta]|nr:septation protein A [gamma proteobacterium symbiont of Bathyaustriella thionipta]MCU7950754.1 septation protein A [gamma proteobacterium symbiont of Bathyaustriella thionipta]MCU7952766.1 septation protein A [gamma proteobacterium symbiont of Bathyaustriella thionipta]MCU7957266.1 septation protein A [gamma proteobacterium symbiont of Bathyaustriella thionipta]